MALISKHVFLITMIVWFASKPTDPGKNRVKMDFSDIQNICSNGLLNTSTVKY